MATINPFQAPINYAVDVQSPFEAALGGFKLGAGLEEINAARQKRAFEMQQLQAAQAQQQQYQSGLNAFFAKPPAERRIEELQPLLVGANKQQFDALKLIGENMGAEKLASSKRFTSQVLLALESNPETAKTILQERIDAETDPNQKRAFQNILTISETNPKGAAEMMEFLGVASGFGSEWYKGISDVRQERRTAALQPSALKKAVADADAAVADAQKKVAEAGNTPDRLKAEQDLRLAQVRKEIADADIKVAEAKDAPSRLVAEQDLRVAQAAQQRALTAASVGAEERAAALQPAALKEATAKADAAVAEAERKVAEAEDTPSRLEAEAQLRQAQTAQQQALTAASVGGEARAAAQAPEALRRLVADADKAIADAKTAQATAANAAETAKANADLAKAQAQKAVVDAKYAERVQIAGLDKTNWDIKNLRDQIRDRSARLNLDAQKTAADVADKMSSIKSRLTEIPAESRKLINESAALASTSKQAAVQFNELAKRIEAAQGGKGAFTSATEWLAKATGRQDEWTQIRNEYTRVRNTIAIKSLPPGVATDKDIELALKGIPPETANAATLASFLRGMAKMQDIDSSINNAKTDWLSQNNGLLTRAKGTFIAGDYAANAGETFNDFAQRIVGDVAQKYRSPEQIAEERRQQAISQIPTNRAPVTPPAAAPAATAASVMSQADAILRGGK
jgi:hypothetical protein